MTAHSTVVQCARFATLLLLLIGCAAAAESRCGRGRIVLSGDAAVGSEAGLEGVAPRIAAGKVRINIDATYPLEAIAQARQHNRNGITRGKVVVAVARQPNG